MIFMTHPKHGFTHAYSPVDIQTHIDNGWIPAKEHKEDLKKEVSTLNLKQKYFEMFHKKPHWNLNRHNLQKALDRGA
jgi:hypothetical protein|tara:strand:+ start:359 stop:589 length:231 start_codon:yes stop_codon:yes gene_type:complete